ncbi:MAG: integrase, partial [Clostridium sp.]|nr:integrase [Clostridium sp.]
KAVKSYAKGLTANIPAEFKIDELDIRVKQARAAKEGMIITDSKTIMPIRANEEYAEPLQRASGDGGAIVVPIDVNKMNQNSKARKK